MTAPKKPDLPVETFDEAYPFLRRPFTPGAVHFKVQTISKDGDSALVIAYIDARNVTARLNAVVGGRWEEEHTDSEGGMICRLTVCGVTHSDWGITESGLVEIRVKGNWSDSLKRAAVRFGVGESLYAIPQVWVRKDRGHLRSWQKGQKWQGQVTPSGEQHLREVYGEWLAAVGVQAFGEPLDHGDGQGGEPVDAPEEPKSDGPKPETNGVESRPALLGQLLKAGRFDGEETDRIRGWIANESGKADPGRTEEAIELLEKGDRDGLLSLSEVPF